MKAAQYAASIKFKFEILTNNVTIIFENGNIFLLTAYKHKIIEVLEMFGQPFL